LEEKRKEVFGRIVSVTARAPIDGIHATAVE